MNRNQKILASLFVIAILICTWSIIIHNKINQLADRCDGVIFINMAEIKENE